MAAWIQFMVSCAIAACVWFAFPVAAVADCVYKPVMTDREIAKCREETPNQPSQAVIEPLPQSERAAPRRSFDQFHGSAADEATSQTSDVDWKPICGNASALAEKIMQARQAGVPMSEMMSLGEGDVGELSQVMVTMAYGEPRYSTESVKQRAITDFRDKMYYHCVKVRKYKN